MRSAATRGDLFTFLWAAWRPSRRRATRLWPASAQVSSEVFGCSPSWPKLRDPGGGGCGDLSRGILRPGTDAADYSDEHRQPGGRAVDCLRYLGSRSLRARSATRGSPWARSLWAGALTLGLLVLPVIVIATQEALRNSFPNSLRRGRPGTWSHTRWQVVRDHVLPSALPGILTAVRSWALSRGDRRNRSALEVVGAAGFESEVLPRSPWDRYTVLPIEIYNYATEPKVAFQAVTAGGILILLMLLLTMNATAIIIRNRYGSGTRG